jgi:beta-lactam-binding protein with PASTA domain
MKSSVFVKKLMSKYLWGNIAAMMAVVLIVMFGVKFGIDIYTHHGEAIVIPNIKNKSFEKAKAEIESLHLQIVVSDTGYVKNLPPDCILEQTPANGTKVKSGHIIYVIINSASTPTLAIPDVIDNSSLREAEAKLTAMGFKLAATEYISGEKDWVYGIKAGGRHVTAGQKVSVEQRLTIIVGNGKLDSSDSIDFVDPVYSSSMAEEQGDIDEFEVVDEPPAEEKTNE